MPYKLQGGQHDQAVFLYKYKEYAFRVEGFIEFFYKPRWDDRLAIPPAFMDATMFTYSIENYGVCGYNAIPSEGKKRQYDTHDFCSILRRYQGRTDFVLETHLAAMFKLDQDVSKYIKND